MALALIGAAVAGIVVVDMKAEPPSPALAEDAAKPIAAPAPPATHPASQTALAELGSSKPAQTAAATVSRPPLRPGEASSLVARPARDANRRGFDGAAGRLGLPTLRDANVMEGAPVPRPLAQRSPTSPEDCKTCGDDVPF